jgi:hypothetical protein
MTPNDARQGVLADRQRQAPRKALSRPATRGQAKVMHDALKPGRAAGERASRRGRQPFRENPLTTGRQNAAKPTRPQPDPHGLALCPQVRKGSFCVDS